MRVLTSPRLTPHVSRAELERFSRLLTHPLPGVCDRLYSLPFFILPKNESKRTPENCKNFIKKLYILILSGET